MQQTGQAKLFAVLFIAALSSGCDDLADPKVEDGGGGTIAVTQTRENGTWQIGVDVPGGLMVVLEDLDEDGLHESWNARVWNSYPYSLDYNLFNEDDDVSYENSIVWFNFPGGGGYSVSHDLDPTGSAQTRTVASHLADRAFTYTYVDIDVDGRFDVMMERPDAETPVKYIELDGTWVVIVSDEYHPVKEKMAVVSYDGENRIARFTDRAWALVPPE